jgi:hypothetical protein
MEMKTYEKVILPYLITLLPSDRDAAGFLSNRLSQQGRKLADVGGELSQSALSREHREEIFGQWQKTRIK